MTQESAVATIQPELSARLGTSPETETETASVRLSEVVSALSYALDITEGQPAGHAVRTCMIGMRVADVIGLGTNERSSLFYALLLKDLGCSSNAARLCQLFNADDLALKRAHKLTDWSDPKESAVYAFNHVVPGRGAVAKAWHTLLLGTRGKGSGHEMTATRCERGADIAGVLGLDHKTQDAIRALDEHWDGRGMPMRLRGNGIPLLARICGLAQTVEVFAHSLGRRAAFDMARRRSGTWFDPALVRAFETLEEDHAFWAALDASDSLEHVSELEPADRLELADESRLDRVAAAFARVIDAKSPYTARHSEGVASIAVGIADALGLDATDRRTLWRAGLLHDIGKLGVSNTILDKPGKLTPAEVAAMREHPRFTAEILGRVRRFQAFAGIAAAHHERLDGTGYHRGATGEELGPLARILCVADVGEALSADRPYRAALSRDEVLGIMQPQVGTGLCPVAFEAFVMSFRGRTDAEAAPIARGGVG